MNERKTLLTPPTLNLGMVKDRVAAGLPFEDSLRSADALSPRKMQEQRQRARMMAKHQQVSERLATASQQLSAGVEESQSAINELSQALEQLSAGAEQSSSACEESSQAIIKIMENMNAISNNATLSMNKSNAVQQLVLNSSNEINRLIEGVSLSAMKSSDSARLISQLESKTKEIGDIIATVVSLSDQTNLLALNAAIEAARAGDHGSGFAVVADEVRTLAEISEKSAKDIRQVVEEIQNEVNQIAGSIKEMEKVTIHEADNGRHVSNMLLEIGNKINIFVQGVKDINNEMNLLSAGIRDFESGSRLIAQAAEEQATGTGQALQAINEQKRAFEDIINSALELNDLTEDLKSSQNFQRSGEVLASSSEELAAAISEASQAAQQIMLAVNSMDQSAETQSAATEQSSTAIVQLEQLTRKVSGLASLSEERINEVSEYYINGKKLTNEMISNISEALNAYEQNLLKLEQLERQIRQIDKIVNTIDKVGIQTNMLAVNGAIEAAGAGKFGRGFAVVAADIRNLAQETAVNAENMKDLVRDIQSQLATVIRDLQISKETSKVEVEKARRIFIGSNQIEDELQILIQAMIDSSRNMTETETAISESRRAVDQIAVTAVQAAAACKQASHAGYEQNVGINELSRAIEEVAGMADDLFIAL